MEKASGNFGSILRGLRKNGNMTQERFSRILDTDRSNIANYESGKRLPPLESLIKIARFFNVSLDYLVFGKDNILKENVATIDRMNAELMAENTILMEAQLKLQEDLDKKEEEVKMLKDMVGLLKKYNQLLEKSDKEK
jgi:transcriptional regulator with XRE-family HTH domain